MMQCDCDVKARFIKYCDLHQTEYERRIHNLVLAIKADGDERPLWSPKSMLVPRVYDRYHPVNCHASMVISDYVCFQDKHYLEKHLEIAMENLLDKLFKEARQFVQINVHDNLVGKEVTAELGVFKREIRWDSATGFINKAGDSSNIGGSR